MDKFIKIIFLAFTILSINISAQNSKGKMDDLGRVILNTYVSGNIETIPSSAKKILANKITQIASKNGMGGSAINPRFIITPNITVLTKDMTPTAPPKTALTIEVTYYLGDGIDGTVFSTLSMEYKGVGNNETKAYIAALKRIKPKNPEIKEFVNEGKTKIIEYYNTKCDFIIKEAGTLKSSNEFDAAITKLSEVPKVCKDCHDKCMDEILVVYQAKIDSEGRVFLEEANNIWNSGQNHEKAEEAGIPLSKVDANASCYNDAIVLSKKIVAKIKAIDKREWDMVVKIQQDKVDLDNRGMALEEKSQQDNANLAVKSQQDNADLANRDIDLKNKQEDNSHDINKTELANAKESDKRSWDLKDKQQQSYAENEKDKINSAQKVALEYARTSDGKTVYNVDNWW